MYRSEFLSELFHFLGYLGSVTAISVFSDNKIGFALITTEVLEQLEWVQKPKWSDDQINWLIGYTSVFQRKKKKQKRL